MGGQLQRPGDAGGDVVGAERFGHAGVHLRSCLGVTVETVEGELLGGHHAGRDLDDTHRLTHQLQAQRVRDDPLGVLGGHVTATAGVGVVGGRGGEEDQVAAPLAHAGQEGLAHAQGRQDVALVHGGPLLGAALSNRIHSQRTAGVIDDRVDRATVEHLSGQTLNVARHLKVGGHPGAAGLVGQRPKALHPPGGGHDLPAVGAQEPDGSGADTRGGPGHEGAADRGRAAGDVMLVLAHRSTIRPRHAHLAQSAPIRMPPVRPNRTTRYPIGRHPVNAVILAVLVMLVLAMLRVHVVLSLFVGALVGGLTAGLGISETMVAFQDGLAAGAKIALSYALLGAFAMAVAHSGLPQLLANWLIARIETEDGSTSKRAVRMTTMLLLGGLTAMAVMSQNLIPVHIAFIPLVVPPLLIVMSRLQLDRRAVTCAITFGLVTTYMFLPLGFGRVFLHDILYANIKDAGLDVSHISATHAMGIPALGMVVGLLIAVFVTYRKPRTYRIDTGSDTSSGEEISGPAEIDRRKVAIALIAVLACFAVQTVLTWTESKADPLLVGALMGLLLFMATRVVTIAEADDVFTGGMRMMALIGLIMITAQGFANVLKETKQIEPLVKSATSLFAGSKPAAAFVMLLVGLIVTMGIGSSFSTLPIISAIYVPLCLSLGFSPVATVSLIGTAGALGDAGSPASDSTLGPTAGLNADGQHDHMRDSVIPTFLHFNIPLLIAGWIAAMVL